MWLKIHNKLHFKIQNVNKAFYPIIIYVHGSFHINYLFTSQAKRIHLYVFCLFTIYVIHFDLINLKQIFINFINGHSTNDFI